MEKTCKLHVHRFFESDIHIECVCVCVCVSGKFSRRSRDFLCHSHSPSLLALAFILWFIMVVLCAVRFDLIGMGCRLPVAGLYICIIPAPHKNLIESHEHNLPASFLVAFLLVARLARCSRCGRRQFARWSPRPPQSVFIQLFMCPIVRQWICVELVNI